ncbi:MAG TPA: GntR family transcriptional regulator, partial [Kofleriaceae bacterium]|nr:GntR family transcriptional regulator [Kofleriaceae bacterium]
MFDPIPQRASANVRAEQQLRDSILAGRLAPGAKLPTERELSAQFGISRLTLRAALATLAAQGLLQVRQGSGYIVRDIRESGGSDLLPAIAARIGAMAGPELADLLR